MSVSISRAWDETRDFLVRERRLVAPVALTFVLLPTVAFRLFTPPMGSAEAAQSPALLLLYVVLFVELIGGMALIMLASGARGPLGQTLGAAFKRALVAVASFILFGLLLLPLMLVFALLALGGGEVPTNPAMISPKFALAVMSAVVVAMLIFFRVSLFLPAAALEKVGPWGALKRGWQLGKGIGLKLTAMFMALFLVSLVVSLVVQWVFGAIAQLGLGGDSGLTAGSLLVAVAVGLVASVFLSIQAVMSARIYAQAAGGGAGPASVPEVERKD
ncbi:hypothetical protein [Sphingomonas mesophila]|uniref:hypothetical protein n=1 Tax=Sphingomonas mesophila TaxID=2303576 RepID=UPI000E57ACAC|nr:hypothetical protein [Sphingomonas mesophila]